MRNSKTQKGITLIALIITIIVLLILAVVAIGAVQNDGIINYAKNARSEYELAQGKENTALANYLAKLEENNPNKVETTKPTSITIKAEETTVEVRKTIRLTVEDENGKEVPLESIEWTSSNETVATVSNGDVSGGSLVGGEEGTQEQKDVTITAKYKEDNSLVATKTISVVVGSCYCAGMGVPTNVCPECQKECENVSLSNKHYDISCMDCGTNASDAYSWVCPRCSSALNVVNVEGPLYDVDFPCGHHLENQLEDTWIVWNTCTDCGNSSIIFK